MRWHSKRATVPTTALRKPYEVASSLLAHTFRRSARTLGASVAVSGALFCQADDITRHIFLFRAKCPVPDRRAARPLLQMTVAMRRNERGYPSCPCQTMYCG